MNLRGGGFFKSGWADHVTPGLPSSRVMKARSLSGSLLLPFYLSESCHTLLNHPASDTPTSLLLLRVLAVAVSLCLTQPLVVCISVWLVPSLPLGLWWNFLNQNSCPWLHCTTTSLCFLWSLFFLLFLLRPLNAHVLTCTLQCQLGKGRDLFCYYCH